MSIHGHFVWYELLTWDQEKSAEFFSNVVGWKTFNWDGGSVPYTMFSKDGELEGAVGGMFPLTEEEYPPEVPNHFVGHIGTDDLETTLKAIERNGGRVCDGPTDIENIGTFAIIADPQGLFFCLFQHLHTLEPRTELTHGDFSWNELITSDLEGGFAFYSAVFGWVINEDLTMENGKIYRLFGPKGSERSLGGMYEMTEDMNGGPSWRYYVMVDDIGKALKQLVEAGGEILNGPTEVPGNEYIAHCVSPIGTAFALHSIHPPTGS